MRVPRELSDEWLDEKWMPRFARASREEQRGLLRALSGLSKGMDREELEVVRVPKAARFLAENPEAMRMFNEMTPSELRAAAAKALSDLDYDDGDPDGVPVCGYEPAPLDRDEALTRIEEQVAQQLVIDAVRDPEPVVSSTAALAG